MTPSSCYIDPDFLWPAYLLEVLIVGSIYIICNNFMWNF